MVQVILRGGGGDAQTSAGGVDISTCMWISMVDVRAPSATPALPGCGDDRTSAGTTW